MSDNISEEVGDSPTASQSSAIFTYTGHSDNIFCIAFSPDSTCMASASRDTTVRVWKVPSGEDQLVYRGHAASLLSVAWSPDGRLIASGDTDGVINVWDGMSGETMITYRGHIRFARCLSWSPDSHYIISGGDYGDNTAQVWEVLTGKLVYKHTEQYRVFGVGWEPAQSRATARVAPTLHDGQAHQGDREGRPGAPVVSCSFDGSVQIWDAFTGELTRDYREHSGPVYAAAWSPDGRMIASGGQDGSWRIWEADTGKTVRIYAGHTRAVKALAWSPDTRYIASGGDDSSLQLWRVDSGERIALHDGYTKWIRSVAWSPDGRYLASASGKEVQITRLSGLFSIR